ncbi:hypothetical protein V3481_014800 [Fusarium oxysporum f. sp. vasinfectum]
MRPMYEANASGERDISDGEDPTPLHGGGEAPSTMASSSTYRPRKYPKTQNDPTSSHESGRVESNRTKFGPSDQALTNIVMKYITFCPGLHVWKWNCTRMNQGTCPAG